MFVLPLDLSHRRPDVHAVLEWPHLQASGRARRGCNRATVSTRANGSGVEAPFRIKTGNGGGNSCNSRIYSPQYFCQGDVDDENQRLAIRSLARSKTFEPQSKPKHHHKGHEGKPGTRRRAKEKSNLIAEGTENTEEIRKAKAEEKARRKTPEGTKKGNTCNHRGHRGAQRKLNEVRKSKSWQSFMPREEAGASYLVCRLKSYITVNVKLAEWLTLPEVPVTVTVNVPLGVPGFGWGWLPPPPQPTVKAIKLTSNKVITMAADVRRFFGIATTIIPINPIPATGIHDAKNTRGRARAADGAVVMSVSTTSV